MDDREKFILDEAVSAYDRIMGDRRNADYVVDQCQMQKLTEAYEFFCEIAADCDGSIEPLKLEPKRENGDITVYCTLLYLDGENLKKFGKLVGDMGAISIDSMSSGDICLSFTIPGVFRHI